MTDLSELEYFAGEWDAEGTFHKTPFNDEKPIRMGIETRRDLGGFWLVTRTAELRTADNPHPLAATYIWGVDPAGGRFTTDWFDSNGGRARQDGPGWDGDLLVFTGSMTSGGFTFALRDTFNRLGADEYHHLGEVDLGEGFIPVDEETARRRR